MHSPTYVTYRLALCLDAVVWAATAYILRIHGHREAAHGCTDWSHRQELEGHQRDSHRRAGRDPGPRHWIYTAACMCFHRRGRATPLERIAHDPPPEVAVAPPVVIKLQPMRGNLRHSRPLSRKVE